MADTETVEVTLEFVYETVEAILWMTPERVPIWIPKSQIEDEHLLNLSPGESAEIEIPEWLAMNEGLI